MEQAGRHAASPRPLRRTARGTLALVPLALGACFMDASLPADAVITCATNADCPSARVCVERAGERVCLPSGTLDTTPPSLSDATVSPELARVGSVIEARFSASEALAAPPTVVLDNGGAARAPFTLDEAQSDPGAHQWVFRYEVNGAEPEGMRNVLASLEDEGGLDVDAVVGSVTLDFRSPQLAAASVSPALARAGASITVRLTASEPLASAPALHLEHEDSGQSVALAPAVVDEGDATWRYEITPTGAEPEGRVLLRVDLEDLAGNLATDVAVGAVDLDFSAPALVDDEAVLIAPATGAPGRRINVEASFVEDIATAGALVAVSRTSPSVELPFEGADSTSRTLRFIHIVEPGSDGVWDLELRGVADAAGNTADALALGAVTFDGTPPALVGFTQSHDSLLASDTLSVAFETDEPLAAEPAVLVGGVALIRQGTSTAPYAYALDMAATALSGTYQLVVRLVDDQDNEAVYTPGTVAVDAVLPALVDVVFTPPAARLNTTAILSVTASEPLALPPTLTWDAVRGDPGFTYLGVSGLGHQWALEVTGSIEQGLYQLTELTLADEAGNALVVDTASFLAIFDVDNRPPVVTALGTDAAKHSAADGFDTIVATFDVDTDLDVPGTQLEVKLGARDFTCGAFQASSPSYTCAYTVDGTEPEGIALVSVRAVDVAGNETAASTAVTLDFTPPALVPDTTNVQLSPPPGSVLPAVGALTEGASARVSFLLDERVVEPITFTTHPDVVLDTVQHSGGFVAASFVIASGAQSAARAVSVSVRDDVGNAAAVALTSLDIDTDPPLAPPVDTPDAVVFRRAPWGAAFGPPTFSIAVDAVEAGAAVIAHSGPTTEGLELGRATLASGSGTVPLVATDVAQLWVESVDRAGNRSSLVRVRDEEWTATVAGKVVGDDDQNPHRLTLFPSAPPGIERRRTRDATEATPGPTTLLAGAQMSWRQRFGDPPSRAHHQTVFDAARGRVAMFGGVNFDDGAPVWTFDGEGWTREDTIDIEGDGDPEGMWLHAMTYDARRGKIVMFGGCPPGECRTSDTWEYDGTSWDFVQTTDPEGDGDPPRRGEAGLAFDRDRGVVVLFSGTVQDPVRNDTWEYDGKSWRRVALTGPAPAEGEYPCLVYDPIARLMTLFCLGTNETWGYDGVEWSVLSTSTPERRLAGATFDEERGVIVMFGGVDTVGTLGDTWTWDRTGWTQVDPGDELGELAPSPRQDGFLAYDSVRGKTVLYGGYFDGDTWTWDGAAWTRVSVGAPGDAPTRQDAKLTYDTIEDRLVYLGGYGTGGPMTLDEYGWQTYPAGGPNASSVVSAAYDEQRGVVVMVVSRGSLGLETWTWDGYNFALVAPSDATGTTAPLSANRISYDSIRGVVVLFGARVNWDAFFGDQTWEWDGSSWTRRFPTDPEGDGDPPGRYNAPMVFDSGAGVVRMFGGCAAGQVGTCVASDFWEWNGASWRRVTPADPEGDGDPSRRHAATLLYDPVLNVTWLFGGASGSNLIDDVWRYDGTSWLHVVPGDPEADGDPGVRAFPGAAYEARRGRNVIVGGTDGTYGNEMWEIVTEQPGPAHHFAFDLRAARLPTGTVLRGATARIVGGASGASGLGAALSSFSPSGWVARAAHGAGLGGAALTVELDDAQLRAALVDDVIHLRTTPVDPIDATILTTDADVTVRVRLPPAP